MASEFTLFPFLPTELRWLIWEACIPRRNIELELPMGSNSDDDTGSSEKDCKLWPTVLRNLQPPLITKICRESRIIAFKNGENRYHTFIASSAPFPQTMPYWFSTKYDKYVLYKTIAQGPYLKDFISGQTWYLGRFISNSDDSLDHFRDAGHYPRFPRQTVCLRVFVLHMNASEASASRLWGTTGEEVIQFVDSWDIEKIKQFRREMQGDDPNVRFLDAMIINHEEFEVQLKRWEQQFQAEWLHYHWLVQHISQQPTPEQAKELLRGPRVDKDGNMMMIDLSAHGSAEYFRGNDDQWIDNRRCLNVEHPWVQLALKKAPEYRATVMFRLCISDCSPSRPTSST